MKSGHRHMIRTLCFDIRTDTEEYAAAATTEIRRLDCESLLAGLLARYNNIPARISIDQLVLDLGSIEPDALHMLEDRIRLTLQDLLAEKIRKDGRPQQTLHAATLHHDHTGDALDVLLMYLETGTMPWNADQHMDPELILRKIVQEATPELLQDRLLPILTQQRVVQRLVLNFNTDTVWSLLQRILPNEMYEFLQVLSMAFSRLAPSNAASQREVLLLGLSAPGNRYSLGTDIASGCISVLIHMIRPYDPVTQKRLLGWIGEEGQRAGVAKSSWWLPVEEWIETLVEQSAQIREQINDLPVAGDAKQEGLPGMHKQDRRSDSTETQEPDDPDSEPLFIDNAGLVLLNGALMRKYWKALAWTDGDEICGKEAREKMILWMDSLVWGKRRAYEYQLLLNKIMVGLDPADVCEIHVGLNRHETDAARDFLHEVIGYWSILGKTSVEAFRTTFLQRPGRLSREDGGWHLVVESKGVDILIDSLPWSFGILKFPWMIKPLYTQWNTRV